MIRILEHPGGKLIWIARGVDGVILRKASSYEKLLMDPKLVNRRDISVDIIEVPGDEEV